MKRKAPLDHYIEALPLLAHVRIMERFFEEVVDAKPETRRFLPELHVAYMAVVNEELAPHALTLALAITELQDAYPAIAADVKRAE